MRRDIRELRDGLASDAAEPQELRRALQQLATKVDSVSSGQNTLQASLNEVTKKHDTLGMELQSIKTKVAGPLSAPRPSRFDVLAALYSASPIYASAYSAIIVLIYRNAAIMRGTSHWSSR
jgi:septal ring factor EnvC (AmiA/AmiB activator)